MSKTDFKKNDGELKNLENKILDEKQKVRERTERISRLQSKTKELSHDHGIPVDILPDAPGPISLGSYDDLVCKSYASAISCGFKPYEANFDSGLDSLDYFVMTFTGLAAVLADFLLVGLPPKTRFTPTAENGVVPEGYLSSAIKKWNSCSNNKLSEWFKVPFDRTSVPNMMTGLNPSNHRFHSFAHDPSPAGFLIGMFDIARGTMSGTTTDGKIFNIPSDIPADITAMLCAPLLWLGHLISDIATPMGLPVPGNAVFQMLRIPVSGMDGKPAVADIFRQLYLQGFDCRHYLAGGIIPGLVEIFVRLYHYIRYVYKASAKPDTRIVEW